MTIHVCQLQQQKEQWLLQSSKVFCFDFAYFVLQLKAVYMHKYITPKYISTHHFKSPFQRAQKVFHQSRSQKYCPCLTYCHHISNVGHHLIVTSMYNQCMPSYYKLHVQLLQLDILNHIQKQLITTQTGNFQNDHRCTSFLKLVHREDEKSANSSAWVS